VQFHNFFFFCIFQTILKRKRKDLEQRMNSANELTGSVQRHIAMRTEKLDKEQKVVDELQEDARKVHASFCVYFFSLVLKIQFRPSNPLFPCSPPQFQIEETTHALSVGLEWAKATKSVDHLRTMAEEHPLIASALSQQSSAARRSQSLPCDGSRLESRNGQEGVAERPQIWRSSSDTTHLMGGFGKTGATLGKDRWMIQIYGIISLYVSYRANLNNATSNQKRVTQKLH
jgi:hypothetical protein